jgi:hypothetical protein
VINGVFAALEKQGLSTTVGIVADEAATVSLAASEFSSWFPSVASKVSNSWGAMFLSSIYTYKN